MGNRSNKCKPPTAINVYNKYSEAPLVHPVKISQSVSNPSLMTLMEEDSEQIELNPSVQFCEDLMDELYDSYILDTNTQHRLNQTIIRLVANIIDTMSLDEHIVFIATQFMEKHYEKNEAYLQLFQECSDRNVTPLKEHANFSVEQRIVLHIMYYLRLHKIVLTMIDDGKEDKMHETINLIALTHLIMKVPPEEFKVQTISFIQNLLHYTDLGTEQMMPFIFYNVKVNNCIVLSMENIIARNALLYTKIGEVNTPSREHYRELKKWHSVMAMVKKSLAKPLNQYEKQVEIDTQKVDGVVKDKDDREQWRVIALLKKGYKFRPKTTSSSAVFQSTPMNAVNEKEKPREKEKMKIDDLDKKDKDVTNREEDNTT